MTRMARDAGKERGGRLRRGDGGLRMGAFYALCLYLSRIGGLSLFGLRAFGTSRVPRTGATVLAANHQTLLDPWLVGQCVDRRLVFLARETLFRVPLLGRLIRSLDAMPLPRESIAPKQALEVSVRLLEEGRALLLFPEGTRSRDGRLQPLRRGIVLLARRTGAPVVPVLVTGAFALWPRTRRLPRLGPVEIRFGEPLRYEPQDSPDSFLDRLAAAYRGLALEAGAPEVLPEAEAVSPSPAGPAPSVSSVESLPSSLAGGGEPPPMTHGGLDRPSRAAGSGACRSPHNQHPSVVST